MSDFLTRVAERALGTAPRIDPQSASRYAPARLPLPESPWPEMTTAAAPDSASIAPPRDSYEKPPAKRQRSRPPVGTPVTEDAVATDPGLKSDRSAVKPKGAGRSLESQSISIAERTQPLESHSRSIAQRNRDTGHPDRASIPGRTSIDAMPLNAFEDSMIRDDDRSPEFGSGSLPNQEPNWPASEGYVSVSEETASPRTENEPQAAAVDSKSVTNDRDVESKLSVPVESIRSSMALPAVAVADDRQPAAVMDHPDPRGAISADFVRPATARVDHAHYEREENSEPTIRVTIGRIEVRSGSPPTVVEPAAPPAPKLSLAEFLRQHNERR